MVYRHCRQMTRAYDVEGADERWLQNILNIHVRYPINHGFMHCEQQTVNFYTKTLNSTLTV